ncbi:MAG: RNA-binding S4 domain-containing protein [Deltaproteobacteria bacterium]|nr:RNA-binding S4 domain-containing protein [Deltaproteobacteria bacterium]
MSTVDPPPAPSTRPTLRLDHFLKREVLVGSGGNAKQAIQSGLVLVNGQVETRRKRQLVTGDVVRFEGRERVVGVLEPRS